MHPNVAGALINSALYLLCVFVAGIATAHPLAWKLAVASFGIAFFSHVAQVAAPPAPTAAVLVFVSWALGMSAGLALLF